MNKEKIEQIVKDLVEDNWSWTQLSLFTKEEHELLDKLYKEYSNNFNKRKNDNRSRKEIFEETDRNVWSR